MTEDEIAFKLFYPIMDDGIIVTLWKEEDSCFVFKVDHKKSNASVKSFALYFWNEHQIRIVRKNESVFTVRWVKK